MVDAKTLRIGNYIRCKPLSIPRLQISHDGIMTVTGYGISVIESDTNDSMGFETIPLTEEWLLKLGGEIKPFSIGIILDRFRFIWKDAYKYWYVVASDPGGAYMTKIDTVHELQNFYFAMNGEELYINHGN